MKPKDGFHVKFTPEAKRERDDICDSDVDLCRRLAGLVLRIGQIGHIGDGFADDSRTDAMDIRYMADAADENELMIVVCYRIVGDTVNILGVEIVS